jgi:ubiquinone/menaquinone biosynthesis C-methylase UbiE
MTQPLQSPYRQQEARSYDTDREREPHWQHEHDYVRALLERRAPKRLLDAPIGTGRFLPLCAAHTQIAGLDLSTEMLRMAQLRAAELARSGLVLVHGSLSAIPFPPRTFDLTLCCRFFHLIPESLLRTMFGELARVTCGRLCVQAYVQGPLRWRVESRLRRISRNLVSRNERATSADPWSHIAAYFHPEALLLAAAADAGLKLASTMEIARYNASRVMMYEWDAAG